jgi:hypothetical protein
MGTNAFIANNDGAKEAVVGSTLYTAFTNAQVLLYF